MLTVFFVLFFVTCSLRERVIIVNLFDLLSVYCVVFIFVCDVALICLSACYCLHNYVLCIVRMYCIVLLYACINCAYNENNRVYVWVVWLIKFDYIVSCSLCVNG